MADYAEPFDCPSCDTLILGATKRDLREHAEDCDPLVALYR